MYINKSKRRKKKWDTPVIGGFFWVMELEQGAVGGVNEVNGGGVWVAVRGLSAVQS
jgi:hypothetical protein